MIREIAVCIFLISGAAARAQSPDTVWTRAYGGPLREEGFSVQQTSDGGFIMAGRTESFGAGGFDFYLIKTDPDGSPSWTRAYGGANWDQAYSVQQTADGGYIVLGNSDSFRPRHMDDVYLIKTDADGDTVWTRTYGGESLDGGCSVVQIDDGGYIVVGYTHSFGAGSRDVYLIKIDPFGDTLWTKTYGGANFDYGVSIQRISEGGYIVAGATNYSGESEYDVYLIKIDESGDTIWTKTYGGEYGATAQEVKQTVDGGYIIVGTIGTGSWVRGEDVYVIKTDAFGDTLWTRSFGRSQVDNGSSVIQTLDGDFVIAGWTYISAYNPYDAYLIKVNNSGDILWTGLYGGSRLERVCSIKQATDSSYIVVGKTESYGNSCGDVWLMKLEGSVVGIKDADADLIPRRFAPIQNYPNPFNSSTVIRYDLPYQSQVTIDIYNVLGEQVITLQDGIQPAGYHQVIWDAADLASGIYFYKLQAGDYFETKKAMLVK